ncbi:hypothetical protein TSUD_06160 [Trifolium subterraneum]|uniref:Uncharacterized protein n=1 Tax=Trifolium subterraneum TaxID=3900 RepID=A0A2Z6MA72_TRISU|nr:hypothetical protein TSUD_06160 [Trifolium subterraneum]
MNKNVKDNISVMIMCLLCLKGPSKLKKEVAKGGEGRNQQNSHMMCCTEKKIRERERERERCGLVQMGNVLEMGWLTRLCFVDGNI